MKKSPNKNKRPLEHLSDDELNQAAYSSARRTGNGMRLNMLIYEILYKSTFKNKKL